MFPVEGVNLLVHRTKINRAVRADGRGGFNAAPCAEAPFHDPVFAVDGSYGSALVRLIKRAVPPDGRGRSDAGTRVELGQLFAGLHRVEGIGLVAEKLIPVVQAVVVRVPAKRVGLVLRQLVAVAESIPVGVRDRRVGFVFVDFIAVGEAVPVGVRASGIRAVRVEFGGVRQAVGIGVLIAVNGAVGV